MTIQDLIEELKKLDANTAVLGHKTNIWGDYVGTKPVEFLEISKLKDGVVLHLMTK